ncbi:MULTISPECIES: hypothetical protein, partial [unclassified Microcoleus]|uniref:hypothetical protein n=1 Tax=unclassified Microcoleus TaxID=2642155 RepID=UPI0025DF4581
MKSTNNLINPPHPRDYLDEHFTNKLWYICIVGGRGRVYEIIHFYRKLLVNPPLQIWFQKYNKLF